MTLTDTQWVIIAPDLATVQSGVFRGRSKISKYGNARLRRTLWLASQAAVLKPGVMRKSW